MKNTTSTKLSKEKTVKFVEKGYKFGGELVGASHGLENRLLRKGLAGSIPVASARRKQCVEVIKIKVLGFNKIDTTRALLQRPS